MTLLIVLVVFGGLKSWDFASMLALAKVCRPRVVCGLKWFLACKYIFKFEMYVHERKAFKKIYEHHFKNL